MSGFLEVAKSDFVATFQDGWIFPLLVVSLLWILWQEKDWTRKILTGVLPLAFLILYWCPLTGMLLMKLLGENVYWRILWLILIAVSIPYAMCLALKKTEGLRRYSLFAVFGAVIVLGGKNVLSTEWFEGATNAYKLPQNVVEVCDLLPGNIHALVSNRLMVYIRQYDPTITLEYGRNALVFNVREAGVPSAVLYQEAQKEEIDVDFFAPLAKEEGCTFLVFSLGRTYKGRWEDYGYREYGSTSEFVIFVDEDYEDGQDTRKWED